MVRWMARVPAFADFGEALFRCAVHQQTQRTYAIGNAEGGNRALVLLDANLQVIATVEATDDAPEQFGEISDIQDVAVHGDHTVLR